MSSEPARTVSRRAIAGLFIAPSLGRQCVTQPPAHVSSYLQRDGGRVLATPRLSGTILPGITRDSILQLARAWGGCDVEERAVTIEEVRQVRCVAHSTTTICS